jgi:UDP-3-O-[3-hydroxymyristoyl] glucosamine N-acyltransferase
MRVRELAEWLGATFEGNGEKELTGVKSLESAGREDLSFVSSMKAVAQAEASAAGCLIVPAEFPAGRTVIRASAPRTAFARAVSRLVPPEPHLAGIDPSAVVSPQAEIGENVAIGPHASIGDGSRIESNCRIGPGCAIGRRVVVGHDSVMHAHVTIYDDVDIGTTSSCTPAA